MIDLIRDTLLSWTPGYIYIVLCRTYTSILLHQSALLQRLAAGSTLRAVLIPLPFLCIVLRHQGPSINMSSSSRQVTIGQNHRQQRGRRVEKKGNDDSATGEICMGKYLDE